jgi:HNH endonuclease
MKAYSQEQEKLIDQTYKYDPLTGVITNVKTGKDKWESTARYAKIALPRKEFGKAYVLLHILAWRLHYGKWPLKALDHKNRIRTGNSIGNLREATARQNAENKSNQSTLGIGIRANKSGFYAIVYTYKQYLYLGYCTTPEEAQQSRKEFLEDFAPHFDIGI